MRTVSAPDSVSLAVHRTRDFLFRPFTWGTYLKLGLVAIVTEGLGSNFNSSSHKVQSTRHIGTDAGSLPFVLPPLPQIEPAKVMAIVAAILLAMVVGCFFFYLVTRLRFAYFHCLIHNTKLIRPGWLLYRAQAARFFWMNLVVGTCFVLLFVLLAIPFAAGFWHLFQEYQQTRHLDFALLLSLVLPLIPVLLLFAVTAALADIVLRDCMLPHFVLENATTSEAWTQVWARILAERKQFFVYALLRVALPIIAVVGLFMLLAIPGLILAGSVAAIEYGIHSTFVDSTGASVVVGHLLEAFFGLLAFGFAVLAAICLGGPVSTAIREFALVFYGSRYRALGDTLYPSQEPSAVN
jgi:hypothetical protein